MLPELLLVQKMNVLKIMYVFFFKFYESPEVEAMFIFFN